LPPTLSQSLETASSRFSGLATHFNQLEYQLAHSQAVQRQRRSMSPRTSSARKLIRRQLSRMMAKPINFSFATAIDHQLADAMCLE